MIDFRKWIAMSFHVLITYLWAWAWNYAFYNKVTCSSSLNYLIQKLSINWFYVISLYFALFMAKTQHAAKRKLTLERLAIWIRSCVHDPHTIISNKETFLQDLLLILKHCFTMSWKSWRKASSVYFSSVSHFFCIVICLACSTLLPHPCVTRWGMIKILRY